MNLSLQFLCAEFDSLTLSSKKADQTTSDQLPIAKQLISQPVQQLLSQPVRMRLHRSQCYVQT